MNILFVNNFRGRGGGEEFLRDLLPGLVEKGAGVGLICQPETPLADMFRNTKIRLHPIERSGRHGPAAAFKMAAVIRKYKYELLNIQRRHDIIQSWVAAGFSGTKSGLLYTVQVAEFMKSRFFLTRMRKIITISRHIRDKISSSFPETAPRIVIIHYGIDVDKFRGTEAKRGEIRKRFALPADIPIIGTVGDLWKNQIEFLDALALVRKKIPEARFALVAAETGIGHIDEFKLRAAQLGLEKALLWTGRLSKDEMGSFYNDIDVAVSTHRNEGFGIWILEALASGTPVVSVNEGGVRDSLEECPGGLLVDGGAEEMAQAVIAILKDSLLHARMASAGPKWIAEKFSRERMVEDYFKFFQSLKSFETRLTMAEKK